MPGPFWKKRHTGSSPLARGTCQLGGVFAEGFRLIPARAGNIPSLERKPPPMPAHPRSRGEHLEFGVDEGEELGSSPLARGTSMTVSLWGLGSRLIPARAGNISSPLPLIRASTAHPRSRGEHLADLFEGEGADGSSPLARGTLTLIPAAAATWRLIPARAGNMWFSGGGTTRAPAHPRSRGEHPGVHERVHHFCGSSPLARGTYLLTWGFPPTSAK